MTRTAVADESHLAEAFVRLTDRVRHADRIPIAVVLTGRAGTYKHTVHD